MPPFVLDHHGADAPAGPLATFLAAVANAGLVAVPVESLGGDPDALWALAGDAEAAGLVDRWPDAEGGPSVVLTAWSVEHLGLRATTDGDRWLKPGEREPVRHRRYDGLDDDEAGDLGWIEGDVPPPIDQLVAEEDIDRRRRSAAAELLRRAEPTRRRVTLAEFAAKLRTGDFPRLDREEVERRARRDPSMIFFEGTGPTWPIRPTPAGECGGCQRKPLEFRTYCLVCDRSGADHLIRPGALMPEPVRKPRMAARGVAAKAGARLKGGIGQVRHRLGSV